MKVAIIGTGYVGLVTGTCFAELGHDVICHDIDDAKIAMLRNGKIPIYEPGLEELVKRNVHEGRLRFTTDVSTAIHFAEVVMSAVGTPPGEDHKADLRYVVEVAKSFATHLDSYKLFINKSTVPVGTADLCETVIRDILEERLENGDLDDLEIADFDLVSNPEFLREGSAIQDTLKPDRIVVGLHSDRAKALMEKLYKPFIEEGRQLIFTDIKSSEVIKYAANAFLATKLSFINEISRFCEKVGADVTQVASAVGLDKRIGSQFLNAGLGYGGSCLPKDVKALVQSGNEVGETFEMLRSVNKVNDGQKEIFVAKLKRNFPDSKNVLVGIWGLSFKPKTDDLRFAPSLEIIRKLLDSGYSVKAFDPVAMERFKTENPDLMANDSFELSEDAFGALKGVDCLMLLTEWDEFKGVDLGAVLKAMKGDLLLDGRNIYDLSSVREAGLRYEGMGRGLQSSSQNFAQDSGRQSKGLKSAKLKSELKLDEVVNRSE